MSLFGWVMIFAVLYVFFLAWSARKARQINAGEAHEDAFAASGIGPVLLFLSFSATLFSTFTLMGIPNYFRVHGVATWLFIGVTDVALGFVVYLFGCRYKEALQAHGIQSMTSLLRLRFGTSVSRFVYIAGIYIFLAPYLAIQIKGVSDLFVQITNPDVPPVFWSVLMLAAIGVYSWVGGFRAIVFSDVVQGLILLVVVWLIAAAVTDQFSDVPSIFETIRTERPELLTAPGPVGLMSYQFVLASFLAILWMPLTQPQLTTRIAASRNARSVPLMALGVSFFALVMLVPTILIGLYGAATLDPAYSSSGFLARVLIDDRLPIIGALSIVGLVAAAMSTADSQLFALGTETQVAAAESEQEITLTQNRIVTAVFAIVCLLLSLLANAELVSLARVSFAGTAIMGPMIALAVWGRRKYSIVNPVVTGIALLVFMASATNLIPNTVLGIRLDLILFAVTATCCFAEYRLTRVTAAKLKSVHAVEEVRTDV